jgi:hypothetical protein
MPANAQHQSEHDKPFLQPNQHNGDITFAQRSSKLSVERKIEICFGRGTNPQA